MDGPDSANDPMEDEVYSPKNFYKPAAGDSDSMEVKQLNLNFKGSSSSNGTSNPKNITTPHHFLSDKPRDDDVFEA